MASISTTSQPWPPQEYRDAVAETIQQYLGQGGLLSIRDDAGPIRELESKYCHLTQQPYALAVNSGTSAMYASFLSLDVGEGDEILVPAYTFHASITPCLQLGATAILCDVMPTTGNIDLRELSDRMSPRTVGIVLTHLYGLPADVEAIRTWADSHGLWLIEDCSHAHGAQINNKPVGSWGALSVFSLQEGKLAPAGEGGIIVTASKLLYEKLLLASQYGDRAKTISDLRYRKYWETGYGMKFRMHPLVALAGLVGIEFMEKYNPVRYEYAQRISAFLTTIESETFSFDATSGRVYFAFRIMLKEPENRQLPSSRILDLAKSLGIDLHEPSLSPLNDLHLFKNEHRTLLNKRYPGWGSHHSSDFPNTEKYYCNLLATTNFWHPDQEPVFKSFLEGLEQIELILQKQP